MIRNQDRKSEKSKWPDARLVSECLKGDEAAWSALVAKYKNLVFSIPTKFGLPPSDAADVFQAVWLDLINDLPKLRHPAALPKWLIQVAAHKCYRWMRDQERFGEASEAEAEGSEDPKVEENILRDLEGEQKMRQAISELPPRCQRLIEMLFFESPPRPYRAVAESLGIATGSVGFIRGRCLERLRTRLEKLGVI